MLIVSLIISILIALFAVFITKSLAHPGSLMATIWALVFTGVFFVKDYYYLPDTLPIAFLLFMDVVFVLTALISGQIFRRDISNITTVQNHRPILLVSLIICLLTLPAYYHTQTSNIRAGFFNPLAQIRQASLSGEGSFYYNFVILSLIVAALAAIDLLRSPSLVRRVVYIIALCIATSFAILTGSKNSILNLAISQFVLFAMLRPKQQFQSLAVASIGALTFFSIGVYFVNFGGREASATLQSVMQTSSEYILGGTLAFGSQFQAIMLFDNNQNLVNGLSSIFRLVSSNIEKRDINFPYVYISDTSVTNVYTILFPLIKEYTVVGAFLMIFFLGILCSYIYVNALRSAEWLIFYALLSNAIILSIVSDAFSFGISLYIKYIIIIASFSFFARLYKHNKKVKM